MAKYKRSKSEGKIAHKKTTIDGIVFDSKMESDYYVYLKEQKALGNVLKFELQPEYVLQPKFFVMPDGTMVTGDNETYYNKMDKERKAWNKANPDNKININNAIKYRSDYKVWYSDGTVRVEDVKGLKTADFKIKEKMFAYRYSNEELICIIWDGPSKAWLLYDDYLKAKKLRKQEKAIKDKEKAETKPKSKPKKKAKK
jgi:hypothetical protein